MDAIRIYGAPFSVHTRKVILAARLKQVAYEVVPVVPVNPDSLPANWREISPTGLIPVIEEVDGFRLSDSTAICLYLDRIAPQPKLLPQDDRAAGSVLFLDSWAGSHLFRNVMRPILHQQVVNPAFRKIPCDEAIIHDVMATHLPEAFGFLESRLSGAYLVAERPTLADLAVVSNLILFHYLGRRIDSGRYPKLMAYFESQLEDPQLGMALRAETPFVERMGLDRSFLPLPT